MPHSSELENLALQITLAAERIRRQRQIIKSLTAANQETWKAVQGLRAMETMLSELIIQRDAMALAVRLHELAPDRDDSEKKAA